MMKPPHPGETIKEDYLVPLGMSVNRLAAALGIGAARLNEIVRGKRGVTADTALRLARCFGTSAEFWLNLQSLYDLRMAERTVRARIEREVTPVKVARREV
jgi:antitoxin HigA-1